MGKCIDNIAKMKKNIESIVEYITACEDGAFNPIEEVDQECERLTTVWLDGTDEWAVITGDYIIADGLTECEAENMLDSIMGALEEIIEEQGLYKNLYDGVNLERLSNDLEGVFK